MVWWVRRKEQTNKPGEREGIMGAKWTVVFQPDDSKPEVVSVFPANRVAQMRITGSWVDTDSDEEVRALVAEAMASGARPTGDWTRYFTRG